MGNEHGKWIMHGVESSSPLCLRSAEELVDYIDNVGFLPLFKNEIPSFSVEEHTVSRYWWSGDVKNDPWEWRRIIAGTGKVAYGKFFGGKAGYISLDYLPDFLNFRRDGYDFDTLWEVGKASFKQKKIMDLFQDGSSYPSYILKGLAGYGRGGESNFEGVVTSLQMQGYLAVSDFCQKVNKKGMPYGWFVSVYATPESIWGKELVTSRYKAEPEDSLKEIIAKISDSFSQPDEKLIHSVIKSR